MKSDEHEAVWLRVWPWLVRAAAVLSAGNLVLAVVVRLWGPALHPLLADPHTWWLFLVTGVSLATQAGLMRHTQTVLMREAAMARTKHGGRAHRRRMMVRCSAGARHGVRHRRIGVVAAAKVMSLRMSD